MKTTHSPKVQSASAKRMGMGETSISGQGRPNGSSLKSPTPRKERQPTTPGVGARKTPYSPEQVREFMDQKAAERKRRIQEERRISKQAQEERNRKLQEVYRKQREAASRRSHRAEQPREGLTSVTPSKRDLGLVRTSWSERSHKGRRAGLESPLLKLSPIGHCGLRLPQKPQLVC